MTETSTPVQNPHDIQQVIRYALPEHASVNFDLAQHYNHESHPVTRALADAALSTAVQVGEARQHAAELHTQNEALQTRLMKDELTGAYSWAAFQDNLRHLNDQRRERHGSAPLGVLFMDLDGFKAVNDNLGHDEGDRVLQLFTQSTNGVLRNTDRLARKAGDEFAVPLLMVPTDNEDGDHVVHPVSEADAMAVIYRKMKEIEQAFQEALAREVPELAARNMNVGVSIGGILVGDEETPEQALKRADVEMYAIKNAHHAADPSLVRRS